MTTAQDWRTEQREAGKRLKTLLIEADLNQVDVAEAIGITEASMSSYLLGRRQWPSDFEQRFRDAVEEKRDAA